jgi:hypothetical protein
MTLQSLRDVREAAAEIADGEEAMFIRAAEHWRDHPEGSPEMASFDRCMARAKVAYEIAAAMRAIERKGG